MSKPIICDRCQKDITEEPWKELTETNIDLIANPPQYDFCQKCADDFLFKFLENYPLIEPVNPGDTNGEQ